MAAERALTIATMIHESCHDVGHPPAASIAPQSANGNAKIECSHLIISSDVRMLWRVDINIHLITKTWRHGAKQQEVAVFKIASKTSCLLFSCVTPCLRGELFSKSLLTDQRHKSASIEAYAPDAVFILLGKY